MAQDLIQNDLHVAGALSCRSFVAPSGSIDNDDIEAGAGIEATKVIHQFPLHLAQAPGTAVVAETRLLHTVRGAEATVVQVEALVMTIATGADRQVSIDLQKGNAGSAFATILSAPIVLDNTNANRTPEVGTVASPDLVDGDTLQLVVTVAGAAGAQAQGLLVTVTLREEPQ